MKKDLIVVFYSDIKYEYQVRGVIESFLLNENIVGLDFKLIYYTIDFDSNFEYKNLEKIRVEKKEHLPRFEFYKPTIILDSLRRFQSNNFLFVDADIIFGRRFSLEKIMNTESYPLLSQGNWDFPFWFERVNENEIIINESSLMENLGVSERSMNYVYACIISYNYRCIEILEEWEKLCNDPILLQEREKFFPFTDETAMNVILWKKNIPRNFGRIYLNTLEFDPFKLVEENEGVSGDPNFNNGLFGNALLRCENSSNVQFYHGMKDGNTIEKCLIFLKEKRIQGFLEKK
jgi:hypothetical protein